MCFWLSRPLALGQSHLICKCVAFNVRTTTRGGENAKDQRTAVWFILNGTWKSKIEIPDEVI